jgi:hypothetical protein
MMKVERKIENIILGVLGIMILASVIGLLGPSAGITGHAVQTTPSQVVIQAYLAIALSNNLSYAIDFGTINTLPTYWQNGTANYNASNQTEYYVSVSFDSNVNADFCVKADGPLNTTGGDYIGLGNYTWEDDLANNFTNPAPYGQAMNISYITGTTGVTPSSDNYYRFWLNVSAGQAAGTYNNTVYFQGVPTGNSCT